MSANQKTSKLPTSKKLEELKNKDEGFLAAQDDMVSFLESRRQAVVTVARSYHLDSDELFQEGYEVLLTCLRDFSPVYEKQDGSIVNVMFTTFFGSRLESRAKEMRNKNPEYQARQAFVDGMNDGEKARFREDPPLLVQHLDQESPMQEMLAGEASAARDDAGTDVALKIMQDSYFDKVLNALVARETDEKKRAALLHVKVGGVYNFQEIAYHFGVTDSRASQVMNELMDAFYVQRMIDGDPVSVYRDFERLKFNEKRVLRLVESSFENTSEERSNELIKLFSKKYDDIGRLYENSKKKIEATQSLQPKSRGLTKKSIARVSPLAYESIFTDEENDTFPLRAVEMKQIKDLSFIDMDFHTPESENFFTSFKESFGDDPALFPAVINEQGVVIDGVRRLKLAQEEGYRDYMCIVRHVPDELEQKLLRVKVNLRLIQPTKKDLYYAISALADLGLSQQRIADCVGTSRTNVLVYCKVKDKASAKMRALFEDGLIQVTNASSCTDFTEDVQDKMADFIRKAGATWSKGAKFNKLHAAAVDGHVDELISKESPNSGSVSPVISSGTVSSHAPVVMTDEGAQKLVNALERRVEEFEQALKDAEVWAARRESVISSQTDQLEDSRSQIEALSRELEAAELMKFGNPKAIEDELKELKKFYAVTERLSGSVYALSSVSRDVRRLKLKRNQVLEVKKLMEDVEKAFNALRVDLLSQEK